MPNATDTIIFILSFFIIYFSWAFLSKMRRRDTFKSRLKDLMEYKEQLIHVEKSTTQKAYLRSEEQALPWLRRIVNKIQRGGKDEQEKLKKLFERAGYRTQYSFLIYGIAKILMIVPSASITLFLVIYFTQWNILYKIAAILASALLGSYLVDFTLYQMVSRRKDRIRRAFPSALDLIVICTEAGLSLTATIQRVAREMSQIAPDLGYELALLSIELNMFSDRRKALQNFSERMDSPYFKAIITNIIQAEQYGTPIAQTMRAMSEQLRLDRLVEAEESAAKLPVLLSLPMMMLIFPCIYIIILGPAIVNILQNFNR